MENLSNIISRVKSYEPLWNGWICTGELLGSGGSGCVLLLSRNEERSVVKVICIDNDPVKYDMVKNEIETMLSLSGDYLVECLDYRIEQVFNGKGECTGFDFLIHMHEYVPLSAFLKEEEYDPISLCRQLASDIGLALGKFHSKGVLHRDIKPENIFIDTNQNQLSFRLGDFGVSKQLSDLSGLTATGTTEYMAPESFHLYKYDYRTDIYSLGITLYYILNDLHFPRFPHNSSSQDLGEDNIRRLNGEKLPPPEFGDETLRHAVLKCCEPSPKNRYQDVSELLNELFGKSFMPFGLKRKKEKTVRRKQGPKRKILFYTAIALSVFVMIAVITGILIWFFNTQNVNETDSSVAIQTNSVETTDPKLSVYTSGFIDDKINAYSTKAETMRKSQNYSYLSLSNLPSSFYGEGRLFDDKSIYIKENEDSQSWGRFTHYTEYCFDSDGKLFYIYWVKPDDSVQMFIYDDDIICMKAKGDYHRYTYGDPGITNEMKAKVTEGYDLYEQYQNR